jgi:NAD(P)-dependent dehydrogenase (short-subunit alcohol dehydrogenase family)
MSFLKRKTLFISGASRGIGLAVALRADTAASARGVSVSERRAGRVPERLSS